MTPVFSTVLLAALASCACAPAASVRDQGPPTRREPIVGGPCEGCEAVFEGLLDDPPSEVRSASDEEPGEPLHLRGRVTDGEGRPAAGIIVYAYHTDVHGRYPREDDAPGEAAALHGRLRAWAQTDAEGRYAFRTIRPGGYPDSSEPQHVHLHVLEPGRCTYYVDSVHFTDDPRLTREKRVRLTGRGGSGVVDPVRDDDDVWQVTRDIVLGEGVPGYPGEG